MPCTLQCDTDMGWFEMHPFCRNHEVREPRPRSNKISVAQNRSVRAHAKDYKYGPDAFTFFRCYFVRHDRREEPFRIPFDLFRLELEAYTKIVFDASITDQRQVRVTIRRIKSDGSYDDDIIKNISCDT